ncbi:MAG TPA: sigma-70 family RNA polymerase sigma factor [Pyrinomonadaceae bacterium]|nr:sigma-70 family RNA polymerase sigma factor [Pyrinomonadaceae bacterium]
MTSFTTVHDPRKRTGDFEELLAWLGPDEDSATEKYFAIRRSLVKIFEVRGCTDAEELADESIDRVAKKAAEIRGTYTGDPAAYFYGVARNVYRESLRRPRAAELPEHLQHPPAGDDNMESAFACLDTCLEELPPENRDLISAYYAFGRGEKAAVRKGLAEKLGVTMNLLRIRAYRIRANLALCVEGCLAEKI